MLSIEVDEKSDKYLLSFERSGEATRAFHAAFLFCNNPFCECRYVGVSLQPVSDKAREEWPPDLKELGLQFNPFDQEITEFNTDKKAPARWDAYCKIFKSYMDKDAWQQFESIVVMEKWHRQDDFDPDKLEFPSNFKEIEGDASVVTLREIFPFARQWIRECDGQEWIALEAYCLNRKCRCQEAFFEIFKSGNRKPYGLIRADYITGLWLVEEKMHGSGPPMETLRELLLDRFPKLHTSLSTMHRKLRKLYANFRIKQIANQSSLSPTPLPPGARPGRNQACPCGSGRKFKKCCGRG